MSNTIIQESFLKDIVEIISTVSDIDTPEIDKKDQVSFTSLTKNANNLILTFPVLCTKSISIETASMISKAVEKNCVTLLQMLLSSIQITKNSSVEDYISQFHSNIAVGDRVTVDNLIAFQDSISNENAVIINDKLFEESIRGINNIANINLNEYSLSDIKCYKTYSSGIETVLEKVTTSSGQNSRDKQSTNDKVMMDHLTTDDIKKANELMPTKVLVNFNYVDSKTKTVTGVKNAIIGVKCKLYPIDSIEIIERLSTKYIDLNWLKQFVRASTGEISFWRDFIFAIDKAKIDAINSGRKGSIAKMFKVLERRSAIYKFKKYKSNRSDASPITTLVISQDEVEYLKKDYDIDIENRKVALKLMDAYNFMGIVIADEPAESASFIWDTGNDANYETLSFRNLERESDDKSYRKVINLMTKISR